MEIEGLQAWLDERFPNKLPAKRVDEFELGYLLGQRNVVEQIRIKYMKLEEIMVNEVTK